MKICKICKNEVPDDSKFCQYCGSSEIVEPVEEKKQEPINDNKQEISSGHSFFLKMLLVISLVFNALLAFNNNGNNKNQNVTKDEYKTKYQDKVKEYSDLVNLVKGTKSYDDFYVDQNILLRPNNKKILVTFENDSEYTVYCEPSATSVEAEWGDWINDNTCELFITGLTSGTFYVDVTNSEDNRVVRILIINE